MITEWLKRNYNSKKFGEPTWQWLVKAVNHPAGGANKALATYIAMRHKAGGMSSMCVYLTKYKLPQLNTNVQKLYILGNEVAIQICGELNPS